MRLGHGALRVDERGGQLGIAMDGQALSSSEREQLRRSGAATDGRSPRHRLARRIPRDRDGHIIANDEHGRTCDRRGGDGLARECATLAPSTHAKATIFSASVVPNDDRQKSRDPSSGNSPQHVKNRRGCG